MMSLTLAIMAHVVEVEISASKSLARRRFRLSHAIVLSTAHRRGSRTKPLAVSDRLMISTVQPPSGVRAAANFSPA